MEKNAATEEDYKAALARVETLMDAEPGSPAEEELERWTLLIEKYEEVHHPIPRLADADKWTGAGIGLAALHTQKY